MMTCNPLSICRCGAPFLRALGRGRPQKYCSEVCRLEDRRVNDRVRYACEAPHTRKPFEPMAVNCAKCGEAFERRRGSGRLQVFCSTECRYGAYRDRRLEGREVSTTGGAQLALELV
jgi:hypothetical protein